MPRPPSRGFTLVEVILVMVVLAAGAAGVLKALEEAGRRGRDAMLAAQAVQLAQAGVEDAIALRRNPRKGYSAVVSKTETAVAGSGMDRTTTVSAIAVATDPRCSGLLGCKEVVVTVSQGGTPLARATVLLATGR